MFRSITGCLLSLSFTGCVTAPKQAHDVVYMDQSFTVDVTKCMADTQAQKSLIIFPPTGGTNIIDRSYLKRFCNNGWNVYLINEFSHPGEAPPGFDIHENGYRNSLRALDLTLREIQTPFVGVLGTSLGATYTAVAANESNRVNAAFMIVGGVPFSQVIATSDHPNMTGLKKDRREKQMFTDDAAYEQSLTQHITLEPTRLGDAHKQKTIGAVISTNDTTVPYATQRNLVEFFKPTTVIELSSSHFWAIVKTWLFHTDEISKFFNDAADAHKAQ